MAAPPPPAPPPLGPRRIRRGLAPPRAAPGLPYRPNVTATTRRDDRVQPGTARKMAAKLQAMGYEDVWFYEPAAGGHGYGKANKERAAFSALGYAFLRQRIGLVS